MAKQNNSEEGSGWLDRAGRKLMPKLQTGKEKLSERMVTLRKQLDDQIHEKSEQFQEWHADRSSLVASDSIARLKSSDNPLVRLEERKVPRHVSMGMVYFAAASGVFANSDEITRFTRDLMDHDSAAVQQWLRRVFDPEEAREISLWMDTSPGSEIAGGWAHRLHHGHDTSALFTLTQEYGATGAIEWANHVWLRDFWTPHGVPYLPAGSGSVYEWLVDAGLSPQTAMSLLTVNAAEAATGLLFFTSGRRMYKGYKTYQGARVYRKNLSRINNLVEEGSEYQALDFVDQMELLNDHEHVPHLRLDLAMFCLGRSFQTDSKYRKRWGSHAFAMSRDLCRQSTNYPTQIPYHGDTKVSFQGLAATVMASAYSSHVQVENSDWSYVSERVQYGVRRFLEVSKEQSKPKFEVKKNKLMGYRPYSALTNQLLALELSMACRTLHIIKADPLAIRRTMKETLSKIKKDGLEHEQMAASIEKNLDRIYPLK